MKMSMKTGENLFDRPSKTTYENFNQDYRAPLRMGIVVLVIIEAIIIYNFLWGHWDSRYLALLLFPFVTIGDGLQKKSIMERARRGGKKIYAKIIHNHFVPKGRAGYYVARAKRIIVDVDGTIKECPSEIYDAYNGKYGKPLYQVGDVCVLYLLDEMCVTKEPIRPKESRLSLLLASFVRGAQNNRLSS